MGVKRFSAQPPPFFYLRKNSRLSAYAATAIAASEKSLAPVATPSKSSTTPKKIPTALNKHTAILRITLSTGF